MVVFPSTLLVFVLVTLSQAQKDGDVRLVGGPASNKGRVEVFHGGVWGTVCDDSWSYHDADIICKQLGYHRADRIYYRAHYGQGTGPILIDQIDCLSAQTILNCKHRGWGVSDCTHTEDAAVDCERIEPRKPRELPVRLSCPEISECGSCKSSPDKFPGKTDCLPQPAVEGIVEAFYDGQWHPVSSDGWDRRSANVVCGELGYPLVMGVPTMKELWCNYNGYYGSDCAGSGVDLFADSDDCLNKDLDFRLRMENKWLVALECSGKESHLLDCYFREFGPFNNSKMQVATVRCGFIPHQECSRNDTNAEMYRLRGRAMPWEGRVEVRIEGEWGTIGDTGWHLEDANVACRALGYGIALQATHRGSFGRGVGKIHFTQLRCTGSESSLSQCSHRKVYYHNHAADAGVVCKAPERKADSAISRLVVDRLGYAQNKYVLVNGPQGWGLLCFDAMNSPAANVICRETSGQFAFRVSKGSVLFPQVLGATTKYQGQINCIGDELSIQDCEMHLSPISRCRNQEVRLECYPAQADLVPDMESFQRSLASNIYVNSEPLYYLGCALEENCLSSSARGKPDHHRRKLLRFSSQTMNYGTSPFQPVLSPSEWIWHSCHNHWHSFEAFIHYDLLHASTRQKAAEGHKASFCLEDSYCEGGTYSSYRCSTGAQGISVNCGDLYSSHLDCQWIDITDVRPGRYIIRQMVNPNKLALESNYENNIIECTIELSSGGYYDSMSLIKDSCRISGH